MSLGTSSTRYRRARLRCRTRWRSSTRCSETSRTHEDCHNTEERLVRRRQRRGGLGRAHDSRRERQVQVRVAPRGAAGGVSSRSAGEHMSPSASMIKCSDWTSWSSARRPCFGPLTHHVRASQWAERRLVHRKSCGHDQIGSNESVQGSRNASYRWIQRRGQCDGRQLRRRYYG